MRNRIPLGCVFVMRYLQAFRFGYAPFRFTHFAKPSLHTCLRTSNPYGIFSIITKLSQGQLVYPFLFFMGVGQCFF